MFAPFLIFNIFSSDTLGIAHPKLASVAESNGVATPFRDPRAFPTAQIMTESIEEYLRYEYLRVVVYRVGMLYR